MPRYFSRHAVPMAVLLLAGGAALAQAPKPAAPAPAAPPAAAAAPAPAGPIKVELAGLTEWLKFCDKDKDTGKEFCVTLRNFGRSAEQPDISMALYDIKGDKQKVMRLQLPPGFMLRPGFRYSFDKSAAQSGTYEICFPNGCFAEAKFEAPVLEAMKKAATLFISVQLQNASELQFSVPLAGFGKALEGPAADPKVIEEQQKAAQQKLEEDLKRQAEQLKGQDAPAPAPAPAPAAPPKP